MIKEGLPFWGWVARVAESGLWVGARWRVDGTRRSRSSVPCGRLVRLWRGGWLVAQVCRAVGVVGAGIAGVGVKKGSGVRVARAERPKAVGAGRRAAGAAGGGRQPGLWGSGRGDLGDPTRRLGLSRRPWGCWRPRGCGACRVLGQPRPPAGAAVPVYRTTGAAPGGRELWGRPAGLRRSQLPVASLLCRRAWGLDGPAASGQRGASGPRRWAPAERPPRSPGRAGWAGTTVHHSKGGGRCRPCPARLRCLAGCVVRLLHRWTEVTLQGQLK